ncbi:MAG: LamG domain-containing protein [Candidatus Latescibacterota bacterium]
MVNLLVIMFLLPACSEDPVEPPPQTLSQIPTNGLLAFYPFEGSVQDASGNANHGSKLLPETPVNTFLTIREESRYDGARLPDSLFSGLGDFTISVWGRITDLHDPGDNTVISGFWSNNMLYVLYDADKDNWVFTVTEEAANFGPSTTIRDGSWHHIVALRNATIARFYFDGVQIGDGLSINGNKTTVAAIIVGQEQDSRAGGFDRGQSWAGDLDNLRIYDRALSSSEIQQLYKETGWGD